MDREPRSETVVASLPAQLSRHRLFAMLDAAEPAPLTVIWGAAGFGKTTLVRAWLAARDLGDGVAWVTIGAEQTDHFQRMRDATAEPPDLLVLDGGESADPTSLAREIARIRSAVPATRILALSRHRSPLASRRAVLTGSVAEIGPEQLAFTVEEVGDLLAGLELPETAESLARFTGGWPVALGMLNSVLRAGRPFDAARSAAMAAFTEFIAEEVLGRWDREQREFALHLSILDDVTAPLAAEVTGRADSPRRLRDLRAAGLLGGTGHPARAFAPMLQDALRRELAVTDPERVAQVHRRAAVAYASRNDGRSALRHAVRCADDELVVDLLRAHWMRLVPDGTAEVAAALDLLTAEQRDEDPVLLTVRAILLRVTSGDAISAERFLRAAVDLLAPDASTGTWLVPMTALLPVERAAGRVAEEQKLAEAISDRVDCLPPREQLEHSDVLAPAYCMVGITWLLLGRLADAENALTAARRAAQAADTPAIFVHATGHLALLQALRGWLDAAERHIAEAKEVVSAHAWPDAFFSTTVFLAGAVVAVQRGDTRQARQLLDRVRGAGVQPEHRPFIAYLDALTATADGNVVAGFGSVYAAGVEPHSPPPHPLPATLAATAHATLLAAAGRPAEAISATILVGDDDEHAVCTEATDGFTHLANGDAVNALHAVTPCLARPGHAPRTRLLALLVAAAAHLAEGRSDAAEAHFVDALTIAYATGIRRPFRVMPPAARAALLARIRAATTEPQLRELCDELAAQSGVTNVEPAGLTAREKLIIAHLSGDLTITDTAKALFVSPNTLKTQLRSIYRKLRVRSRGAAIAEARRLNLI